MGRKRHRVSIDIQKMGVVNPSLSRYTMSPAEMQKFFFLNPDEQKQYFYELWTRKESYLKMEGIGVTVQMGSVFSNESSMNSEIPYPKNGNLAYFTAGNNRHRAARE
ncbi:4'-phosphopantetheinyl transferase family protein [Paenibacillus wynnii]|uniref:4'-phosphopantetheinyl transferase family protein n=1 Tax=Paenibacillus wynnii TaxID=268407 RepID=UPI00278D3676|nr:4'-phosphopantetheinyl transferase superfamily protein [Paenibacillus wynnii]MDQ0194330.1 phosphopantetheinyl transferase [Paenibacillus wynnii]